MNDDIAPFEEEKVESIKLRPVVYTSNTFRRGSKDTTRQIFLLKALQITQDPDKLRKMLHLRTVAGVYRTLDKLSMRREYHEALARAGISFDYIIDGIKRVAESGYKDVDRLKALQTLLKSVGLDTYKAEGEERSGTWEEELLKTIEMKKEAPQLGPGDKVPEYEVKIPEVPESVKKMQEEEKEILSSVYDEQPAKQPAN